MIRSRFLTLAVVAAALIGLTSCEAAGPTELVPRDAQEAAERQRRLFGNLTLLSCTPLPADTVTEVIGPSGGVLQIGPHTFSVPAGALDSSVAITAIQAHESINRLTFSPSGLQFDEPAILEMSYANCFGAWIPVPRKIVQVDGGLDILEILLSLTHFSDRTVSGEVEHFSDYAVAW